MIRLAELSIRGPRAALAAWAVLAVVLGLIGLGVSHSLSPSITTVPGSESSRAQDVSRSEFGPSVLVPILLEGPATQVDRQGPKLALELSKRADTRVMSAWSRGATGAALRPRPGAAMIVASVARTERAMVDTVQPQIDRTVDRMVTGPVKAHVTGQPTLDRALRDEAIETTRRAELIAVGVLFMLLLIGLRRRSRRSCSRYSARARRSPGSASWRCWARSSTPTRSRSRSPPSPASRWAQGSRC